MIAWAAALGGRLGRLAAILGGGLVIAWLITWAAPGDHQADPGQVITRLILAR